MPELTPESIRSVQFREKLRGYHPEDVDTFVADVAATVEGLQRKLAEASASAQVAPVAGAPATDDATAATTSDVEESLRRTLILAQRTADMAVKEAQDEAARLVSEAEARRASIDAEADETRARTMAALEHELSGYRQRLYDERDALQRDVAALQSYVAQERERLRIYFSQQLEQLEGGVPTIAAPPQTEAPQQAPQESVVVDAPGLPEQTVDAAEGDGGPSEAADDAGDAADDVDVTSAEDGGADDDPFLAELRRATTDTEPLGPRDDEPALPPKDERDLDIFNDDDGGGRFLRRRR